MKGIELKRFAWFLIVILCLKDFSNAKYISRPARLQVAKDNKEKAVAITEENTDYEGQRQKRWVTIALLGTALLATTASITTEILLAIHGCCLPNPRSCEYETTFQNTKTAISADNDEIDRIWQESQIKFIYIDRTNLANVALWNELERISNVMEVLINDITPEMQREMLLFNNIISDAVAAGNTTVTNWSETELSTEYDSYFKSDWKFTTLRGAGYLFLGGQFILEIARSVTRARNYRNFVAANQAQLATYANNPRLIDKFGDPADLLNEAKAAYVASNKHKSTFTKIKNAGSILLNIGLIGLEIWMTVEKFQACNEIERVLKNASETIVQDRETILELKKNVTDYNQELIVTYETQVKDQVTNDGVLNLLVNITNMLEATQPQPDLQDAINVIKGFNANIKDAGDQETYDLVEGLKTALQRVEFTLQCMTKKTNTVKSIRLRCQQGHGELQEIYDATVDEYGTNVGECTTDENLPFTHFSDVEDSIRMYAEQENFYFECKLNNPDLLAALCSDKCSGFSKEQSATRNQITEAQYDTLIAGCTALCPVPDVVATEICTYKGYGVPFEAIYAGKSATFTREQVQSAYDAC